MDIDRWKRTRELFEAALRLEVGEREAYLETECRDDPELVVEVKSLLAAHDDSEEFLELPEGMGLLGVVEQSLRGTRIGHYLLEEVLSEGGMGTVYRAQQENPARTVAIKVMREGLTSPAAVRRFEYEAQVLARLTHPHIAQVYEAGAHRVSEGVGPSLPYFVMEYVPDARSLTEYAWENQYPPRKRLQLFLHACEAVMHGHRRGIIHRDLKPSNILVDGNGQVKIIDFGVARTTDADLRLTTALTDVGQLIGTVQYMSPEQCSADPEDLDTRSDVYALGVVLYELLCEELPYEVHRSAIFEATRIVRESPPKRPSSINRRLRGDVETIVLKALEKDRGRRYQSVGELAADIERHLRGELIHARPVGPVTQLWMRIQRNPAARAALAVGFLSLVAFTAYVTFVSLPAIRAEQRQTEEEKGRVEEARKEAETARDREEERRKEAEVARASAERNERLSRSQSEFLRKMLSAANLFGMGREAKIVDVLGLAEADLGSVYADEPEVQVELRRTLAWTYHNLGQHADAEGQWRKALEVARHQLGPEHQATLEVATSLAQILVTQSKLDEASSLLEETIPLLEHTLRPDAAQTLYALSSKGRILKRRGMLEEAEALYRDVYERQLRVNGPDHRDTLYTGNLIVGVLVSAGRYAEAEEQSRIICERSRKTLGKQDPETLDYLRLRGDVLGLMHRDEESVELFRELLEAYVMMVGDKHSYTLSTLDGLALALAKLGQMEEAEQHLQRAVEIALDELGQRDLKTLSYQSNLGTILARRGRMAEARQVFEKVLEIRLEVQGPDHNYTLGAMSNLALCLQGEGSNDLAESMQRELLDARRRKNGPTHPYTLSVMSGLADTLLELGKLDESEEITRELITAYEGEDRQPNYASLNMCGRLGRIMVRGGRLEEAEVVLVDGVELAREVLPADSPVLAYLLGTLGNCELRLENWDVAEDCLLEAWELHSQSLGPRHRRTWEATRDLVKIYESTGRPEEAEEWQARLDG